MLSSLLLRTAARASALDPGFDLDSGVVARIALDSGRSADGRLMIAEQLTDRLQSLPGVRAASVASMIPLGGDVVGRDFDIRGSESHQDLAALVNVVGPRYFEALRIPLTRGREFGRSDRSGAPPVVIVNQAFARRSFTDVDPLGRFIRSGDEPYAEVVGVAADTKFVSLAEVPRPLVYYCSAAAVGSDHPRSSERRSTRKPPGNPGDCREPRCQRNCHGRDAQTGGESRDERPSAALVFSCLSWVESDCSWLLWVCTA